MANCNNAMQTQQHAILKKTHSYSNRNKIYKLGTIFCSGRISIAENV